MRRNRQGRSGTIDTLIGAGTTVTGDVNFQGGLHLEGRVEGNVNGTAATARFDLSEAGSVVGEIHVSVAVINGSIEGDLHATERLVLGQKARVDGNVFYHVLEMAGGAQVNGQLIHRPYHEPLALEHRAAQPESEGD